jgi:hypothetical protein
MGARFDGRRFLYLVRIGRLHDDGLGTVRCQSLEHLPKAGRSSIRSAPLNPGFPLRVDAVDKVGDEQRVGNNRIQVPSFFNQYCAPDSDLESMLLACTSKNVFRQHRSLADESLGPTHVRIVP